MSEQSPEDLASALRHTRERLEMLSAASFEGLFIHIDGVVIDANLRVAEMLGYTVEEMIGPQTMLRCVAPEDLPGVRERMMSGYEGAYVITAVRKDGSRFRAELQAKQGKLGERPVRVAAVRDVTERERRDVQLRESEARLRALAEAAFDLFVVSRETTVIDVGGAYERILGYTREQIVGRSLFDFVDPSALEMSQSVIAEQRIGAYESRIVSASGEVIPMEIVGAPSTYHGEPVRLAGLRDKREAHRIQAERQKLQQRIERSQRMESLGVLAGGIAHDFNNLLMGVLGHAQLLEMRLTDSFDLASVAAIRAAGERAASLTQQMLAYAGRRAGIPHEPVELRALLSELQTLLEASLSKKAQLSFQIATDCTVLADRTTLAQVLMNLLTNASDALEGQPGRIDVRARRIQALDARWDDALGAAVPRDRPGDWVLVEVRDTGIGMDDETRGRIFEPFFSTKRAGHGLGLAACVGIMSAHGGAILVESEPGQGTCFSLLIPATDQAQAKSDAPRSAERVPCSVLVIDDEALVRSQLCRLLELEGFAVHEASNGRSGIEAHARVSPDVIVLDLSMPDLDGAEVAAKIRAVDPAVPILLSSGYIDRALEQTLSDGVVQGFLNKPYKLSELLDAIERVRAIRPTIGPG